MDYGLHYAYFIHYSVIRLQIRRILSANLDPTSLPDQKTSPQLKSSSYAFDSNIIFHFLIYKETSESISAQQENQRQGMNHLFHSIQCKLH